MLGLRPAIWQAARIPKWTQIRAMSTLEGAPYIYVFPDKKSNGHVLSLLPSEPTKANEAIGTTSELPPTPDSFKENPRFLETLQSVMAEHAYKDPDATSQAQVMASQSGANLSAGGMFFNGKKLKRRRGSSDSSGGASGQGGVGSAGKGGWIHISDSRKPVDFGRIAWPEDIFGSLEVDGTGQFVSGNGNYQSSGTYRIVTREGILGLSPFLREKLVEKLRE